MKLIYVTATFWQVNILSVAREPDLTFGSFQENIKGKQMMSAMQKI